MNKPYIAWINSDWNHNEYRTEHNLYGGIGYYRVVKPAQALEKWFEIDVIGADIQNWGTTAETYNRLGQYDLIITKHSRSPEDLSNTLAIGKHFKKKVLLDIDDDFLSIREDNPAFKDYEYGQGPREYLSAALQLADGVIVSTAPLKKVYSQLNKKIDVLPNCSDINDWPKERKIWNDGKVRIGFAGGLAHYADLELILEPMAYILAKYPNVLFEVVGAIAPQDAMRMCVKMNEFCKKNISEQFRIAGGTLAWQGYPEMLNNSGWDIVIAPLIDDAFNRGKSHIRWMESSMVGCTVVASPVYPYKEKIFGTKVIEDGITGMHAYNSEDWFNKLSFLIEYPNERKQVAQNAYEYIKDNWQWEQWSNKYKKVIEKYL